MTLGEKIKECIGGTIAVIGLPYLMLMLGHGFGL